jgi:CoA:oxalate CoA-transferase
MTATNLFKPLEGMLILDFSQFLSGPSASLRLADMGARVIKIERRGVGDICRTLYISNQELDGDSTLFHSINRNKESFEVDLKNSDELALIKKLICKADIMIGNFRPGVMERLGLDYEHVQAINPKIVYGEISGYGDKGPWRDKPGQDLLIQSVSGLAWLNGDADQPPMPFGLAVADMIAGAQLAQGILACLVRRGITGRGALVQTSLLEATIDFQFEVLSTYLNDGRNLPERSSIHNAHAYLGAPYGIYRTNNGYLALAMGSVVKLGLLLNCPELNRYTDPSDWSSKRDEIKQHLVVHLQTATTEYWLSVLEPADYWCADVLNWSRLLEHEGFKTLQMTQQVTRSSGAQLITTRCPIQMDGQYFISSKGSPRIGEHNAAIIAEIADAG